MQLPQKFNNWHNFYSYCAVNNDIDILICLFLYLPSPLFYEWCSFLFTNESTTFHLITKTNFVQTQKWAKFYVCFFVCILYSAFLLSFIYQYIFGWKKGSFLAENAKKIKLRIFKLTHNIRCLIIIISYIIKRKNNWKYKKENLLYIVAKYRWKYPIFSFFDSTKSFQD